MTGELGVILVIDFGVGGRDNHQGLLLRPNLGDLLKQES